MTQFYHFSRNLYKNLTIDKNSVKLMLDDIKTALLSSDIPVNLVNQTIRNLRKNLSWDHLEKYVNKKNVIKIDIRLMIIAGQKSLK